MEIQDKYRPRHPKLIRRIQRSMLGEYALGRTREKLVKKFEEAKEQRVYRGEIAGKVQDAYRGKNSERGAGFVVADSLASLVVKHATQIHYHVEAKKDEINASLPYKITGQARQDAVAIGGLQEAFDRINETSGINTNKFTVRDEELARFASRLADAELSVHEDILPEDIDLDLAVAIDATARTMADLGD